ncbi:MAG TPA: hypothetical protein VL977_07455 [Solirubrobacteraceae bacterium]|nr:hypothetical protein [Solirubrobacteraceae bacterium]
MRRTVVLALLAGALCCGAAQAASSSTPVKLPKKLTSPSGNFFTLYAFDQPTSGDPVASAEIQVCASATTPEPNTYLDPALFTVKLTSGKTVGLAKTAAHKPQLVLQHLNPRQCSTKGWMSFDVPSGSTVAQLVYDYDGKISWKVG